MNEEVVHDHNYWGYHVYVIIVSDLAPEEPITVSYRTADITGVVVVIPRGKWDQLVAAKAERFFLLTTKALAQTFIARRLAPLN